MNKLDVFEVAIMQALTYEDTSCDFHVSSSFFMVSSTGDENY